MKNIINIGLGVLCCAVVARAERTNFTGGALAGISGVYDSLAAETTNSPPAVCLIDMRHPNTVREAAQKPPNPKVQPYLDKMRARHAELSGLRCVVIHYTQLKAEDLPRTNIRVLLINALDKEFSADARAELLRVIRETKLPIFGFCGGHQLIVEAFGGQIAYMRKLRPGEADPRPSYQPGQFKEWGFMPVRLTQRDPVFLGLGDQPVVRQMHAWHITKLPAEFTILAASDECPIQAIKHKQRLIYGTQFHPEQYDDEHPDGRTILHNFYQLAGFPAAK
jgi:GMP synthase-like glutamine amidotransferase